MKRPEAIAIFITAVPLLAMVFNSCCEVSKEKYADTMTVIEKYTETIPAREEISGYGYCVSGVVYPSFNVVHQPEKTKYYIKTSRKYESYTQNIKTDAITNVSTGTKVKKYEVTKKIYDAYSVGTELVLEDDIWKIKNTSEDRE